MAKFFTFHAPKTAGNSILTLNIALTYQWQNPHQRVALIELNQVSDLSEYTKTEATKFWGDLAPFYKTDEWGNNLLERVKYHNGVDQFFSDDYDSNHFLEKFWPLLNQNYEVVFVDLGSSFAQASKQFCLANTDHFFLTSTLDPISLNRLSVFLKSDNHKSMPANLIILQCPKDGFGMAHKAVSKIGVNVAEIFVQEEKTVWPQVFEGVPIVAHKKSNLAKTIGNFCLGLNNF